MATKAYGALAGWKRAQAAGGVVLTIQLAPTVESFKDRDFDLVNLTMNDRQLRSLARDLRRACQERGIVLDAPEPVLRRIGRVLMG